MNETGPAGGRTALDGLLRTYLRASRWIVVAVSCAMFAFMVAVNSLEIVGRGLFSTSFSWVQEVSILAAMWIYFFAYALIAKNEEYIRVDFAAQLMSDAWRWAVEILARLLTIAFHLIVMLFAIETYRFLGLFTTSVLIWPESLFVLPLLLGSIDILITEIIHFYWQVTRQRPHQPHLLPAGTE